ncbi:MAG: hypothetical protein J7L54_00915 [Elusimicrobia bacterium]|nr:hypothetical protein [Elusimicrobiota bacterium]
MEEEINREQEKTEEEEGDRKENRNLANEIVDEMKKFFTFDILNYIRKPWKLIGLNFFMGLVRGIGFFLGMTIVGAIVVAILAGMLRKITQSNIPGISHWLANIVAMVQDNLKGIR